MRLADRIRAEAGRLGFDLAGITPARPLTTADHYRAWLEKGYHGEMAYLAHLEAADKRADLSRVLPGVRSVVAVAANYHTSPLLGRETSSLLGGGTLPLLGGGTPPLPDGETSPLPGGGTPPLPGGETSSLLGGGTPPLLGGDPGRGSIASYARGDDYHGVLAHRLGQLGAFVEAQSGGPVGYRAYVDTGPLLERELAARAGLGFVGKNGNLIHPRLGSWLFLGALLLDVEIQDPSPPAWGAFDASQQPTQGTCGQCSRCLEACPTAAFAAPYVLDARRCISYLTIELRGPIPRDLRPLLGNRIFGCDVCQEVCPWNRRFARPTAEPAFQPRPDSTAPRLLDLIGLDEEGFRQRFRNSPVRRAKRQGLLRNVAVALGNWGDPAAVPALARALHDPAPLVRGHAAWALGRIHIEKAHRALEQALTAEGDVWVREEIYQSLIDCQ